MKRFAVALILLAAAAPVSACAIGPGPVVSHGKEARPEIAQNPAQALLRPEKINDAPELVKRYLNAAADKPDTQLGTLRSYMHDKTWKPSTPSGEINIYRVGAPSGSGQSLDTIPVSVPMQRIGVLRDHRIDPVFEERVTKHFSVVDTVSNGYMLKDAPTELMMSDTALAAWFEQRPLYFWDKLGKRLVPDMRYIPRYLLPAQKAKLLFDYLYNPGPSPWLVQAVKTPPNQMPLITQPVYTNGALVIDLPNQLSQADLPLFYSQLERILGQDQTSGLQLKIRGVSVPVARNDPADDSKLAARFAVQQGKVIRPESESISVPLANDVNTSVAWAQFSRGEQSVALARMEGGVQHFYIGPGTAPKPVTVTNRPVDQAIWLGGDGRSALVLSDHKLFEVVPGESARVTQLVVPVPGAVTSFSVTPDGCIAMVIDNKLYLAALYHNADALVVTQPQQVPTGLDQVQHVALGRNEMLVAGVGKNEGQTSLLLTHMNIDGTGQTVRKSYQASQQISHLVIDYRTGTGYFDYNSTAQVLTSSGASQYAKAGPPPSPSPSGSPTPPPPLVAVSFEG